MAAERQRIAAQLIAEREAMRGLHRLGDGDHCPDVPRRQVRTGGGDSSAGQPHPVSEGAPNAGTPRKP
jgi:hypothetical protein